MTYLDFCLSYKIVLDWQRKYGFDQIKKVLPNYEYEEAGRVEELLNIIDLAGNNVETRYVLWAAGPRMAYHVYLQKIGNMNAI